MAFGLKLSGRARSTVSSASGIAKTQALSAQKCQSHLLISLRVQERRLTLASIEGTFFDVG